MLNTLLNDDKFLEFGTYLWMADPKILFMPLTGINKIFTLGENSKIDEQFGVG